MKILPKFYLKLTLCILLSISFYPGNLYAQDAQIWRKFTGEINDPSIPVLPNYGYAGYKLGQEAIPETHPYPVFDVTNYGAVPNDQNSDQAAIQAAIDAAEANGSGVVFFPPGEFLVNTEPSPSTSIRIESSNIILKGSGSTPGGTIINMKNRMQPPPGGGGIPEMFIFQMPWSASATSLVTQDADRGDMFITVQDASLFQGRKYCRMGMPNSLAANSQFLEGRSPQSTWTKVYNDGVSAIEYHEIESIDVANNRVYFKDPLVDDVKVAYGWDARSIELMEGSGFEDIHFKANFFDNYVHHQHVGWAFMKLERTAHSWVRRVRISNVISIMAVRNSYAVSVIQLLVDGNRGHTTVGTVVSTRILTGLTWDNTNNSQWHGSGFATGANGSVVWRVDATKGESHDIHGDKPRTNLIDLYTSVDLTGNGGAVSNLPHHLSGLTIWNQKRVGGSGVNNYNVWGSGWWLVNPIIVGMHGTNTTFNQSSLKYEESNGTKVSPASLYEAQVEHNLGFRPAWMDAAIAEYESLKTGWYAEPVSGVSVSPTTKTLGLGQTFDLTATVSPANAANTNVTWSSSNASVATVDSNGSVTAVAEGNATITATTVSGGFTATCAVTVSGSISVITLNPQDDGYVHRGINSGTNYSSAVSLPVKSSNSPDYQRNTILKFDLSAVSGSITEATLRMYGKNNNTSDVSVFHANTDSWSENTVTASDINSTGGALSSISVTPTEQYYSWDVSSQVITEAGGDNVVSFILIGSTTNENWVSFHSKENTSNNAPELVVTVTNSNPVAVNGVSVSPTSLSLNEGQTSDLTETVSPSNATNKSVSWSSNNTSVATVNSSGLVTAASAGSATITVTTTDGGFTATSAVTVTASGGGPSNPAAANQVCFFDGADWSGFRACIGVSQHNFNSIHNNNVSAVSVGSGVHVIMYENTGYTGASVCIAGGTDNNDLGALNNAASSFQVISGDACSGSGARISSAKADLEDENVSSALSIYPNPIGQGYALKITFPEGLFKDRLELVLTNLSGQEVLHRVFELRQGMNNLELKTTDLKPGVYIVQLTSSQINTSRKILVKEE